MVEFALILPILLAIVLGIFQFGAAYNYQNDMSQLANEAARYASVGFCDGCVAGSASTEIPAIVKKDADTGGLKNTVTICIVFPPGSSGQVGDSVEALVEKNFTWIPYLNLAKVKIVASATMRLETAYNASTSPYTPDTLTGGNCSAYNPNS
jgi:hypothetical protein